MDKHSCKICDKRFGNGRALGGHMRSHMAKLPLPPKPTADQPEGSEEVSSEPDSDRTSDTQSWPSKRPRAASETAAPGGSASETNPAADIAEVLLMMSRDSWRARKEAGDRNDGGFRCDTCGKVFRSGKALGGHKASHKRAVKGSTIIIYDDSVNVGASFHECPYCFKVFGSGKALGGHKKIHLATMNIQTASASVAVSVSASVTASSGVRYGPNPIKKRHLDLNLPPQSDEEGGDNSGHFPEMSAGCLYRGNGSSNHEMKKH